MARWTVLVTAVGNPRRRRTAARFSAGDAGAAVGFGKQGCGRDGIFDPEVDADASDRRHRVRGVADAQQSVGVPAPSRLSRTSRLTRPWTSGPAPSRPLQALVGRRHGEARRGLARATGRRCLWGEVTHLENRPVGSRRGPCPGEAGSYNENFAVPSSGSRNDHASRPPGIRRCLQPGLLAGDGPTPITRDGTRPESTRPLRPVVAQPLTCRPRPAARWLRWHPQGEARSASAASASRFSRSHCGTR